MKVPDYYLPVMPYLILKDSAAFLEYAKRVFGATEHMIVPGEDGRSIMHGEIGIGKATIMFANANEQWQEKPAGMFIYVSDVDKVYNAGVEQGGTSLGKPTQKEYGYSGGFEDPFGNQWWVAQAE
jgi:PhnB protein